MFHLQSGATLPPYRSKALYPVLEVINMYRDSITFRIKGGDNLKPFFFYPELFQHPVKDKYSLLCLMVSILEVAVALPASEEENALCAFLRKSAQNLVDINLSKTDHGDQLLYICKLAFLSGISPAKFAGKAYDAGLIMYLLSHCSSHVGRKRPGTGRTRRDALAASLAKERVGVGNPVLAHHSSFKNYLCIHHFARVVITGAYAYPATAAKLFIDLDSR